MVILAIAYPGERLNAQETGVSISDDNSSPNANAMLEVKSPATGAGKGILIPRITIAQRTTANSALAGGLLNDAGKLRGGAAQGLLVYQTDANTGFYYNTSATDTPSWFRLPGSTNEGTHGQFLQTDGIGAATWQTVATPIPGTIIAIGTSSYASGNGIVVGVEANSRTAGTAIGYRSNSSYYGAAFGYKANGIDCNVAVGYCANAFTGLGPYAGSVSVGYRANSFSGDGKYTGSVAIGYRANARHNFNENDSGAIAIGFMSNAFIRGVGVGYSSAGYNQGVGIGYLATGSNQGVGVGYKANAAHRGTALGYMANSGNKHYSIAKGPYSRCSRYNEEWKVSDGISNKFGYGKANFHASTTSGNTVEIYLGGTSNQRFLVSRYSVVSFEILVSAYNTANNQASVWRCWGGVKRGDHQNTTQIIGTVAITANTQGSLNNAPTITADTTNGALKLEVTGVNGNTVKWNARMAYSEVRK